MSRDPKMRASEWIFPFFGSSRLPVDPVQIAPRKTGGYKRLASGAFAAGFMSWILYVLPRFISGPIGSVGIWIALVASPIMALWAIISGFVFGASPRLRLGGGSGNLFAFVGALLGSVALAAFVYSPGFALLTSLFFWLAER